MATAKDFQRLTTIDGVSNYILVKTDGNVITHNVSDPTSLSSTLVISASKCQSLEKFFDGKKYLHLCIERENGDDLMVFPLGPLYLGIIKENHIAGPEVADNVIDFLREIQ